MTSTTAYTTETTTTVASTTTECLYVGDHDYATVACPTAKRKKRFLSNDADLSFSRTQPSPAKIDSSIDATDVARQARFFMYYMTTTMTSTSTSTSTSSSFTGMCFQQCRGSGSGPISVSNQGYL